MIRSEIEYKAAVARFNEQQRLLDEQQEKLKQAGLGSDEIKRVTDPIRSFRHQLLEEIESYERLKRGDFGEIRDLRDVGQLLIAARIYRGFSQRELAERLGVHESQVSRDERNEYHGITVERAARILELLSVKLRSHAEALREEAVA
jgi:ribosome-binding protein aMBF1 (putative translation factor)